MKRFSPEEGWKKLASACLPLAIYVFLRMNIVGELMVSVGERREELLAPTLVRTQQAGRSPIARQSV